MFNAMPILYFDLLSPDRSHNAHPKIYKKVIKYRLLLDGDENIENIFSKFI